MFHPIHALIDRIKAWLATLSAAELEVEALAHHADRKASLLRLAEMLEAEDLHGLALELRQQAEALDGKQSTAGVTGPLPYWHSADLHPALPAPPRHRVASVAQPGCGRAKPRR